MSMWSSGSITLPSAVSTSLSSMAMALFMYQAGADESLHLGDHQDRHPRGPGGPAALRRRAERGLREAEAHRLHRALCADGVRVVQLRRVCVPGLPPRPHLGAVPLLPRREVP